MMAGDPRARVPSVSALLQLDGTSALIADHGHHVVVAALRSRLDTAREAAGRGGPVPAAPELLADVAAALARAARTGTQRVVNATGVVLHTNLGRAPLCDDAISAMVAAAGASTVEYDLDEHRRVRRGRRVRDQLCALVGADDAEVVNNGAAALVLALAALAGGQRVAVSRGELVEIGGSFRLPEIIEAAGVGLVEVGTTNRTRVGDYVAALSDDPAVVAVLRVHPSNFRVEGFAERPDPGALARAAHERNATLVHDVGSGVLHDALPLPAATVDEPSISRALADGADVVVASGDKLLGGPQCGLLVGTATAVAACRDHPLARALRVDKLRLAALEATLDAYLRDRLDELPTWAALRTPIPDLERRAKALVADADDGTGRLLCVPTDAVVGGGTLPGTTLRSVGVILPGDPEEVAALLARAEPPIVGRVVDGRLVLDLRTVPADQDEHLGTVLRALLHAD